LCKKSISKLIDLQLAKIDNQNRVDELYGAFCKVYYDELERNKLVQKVNGVKTRNYNKPWWNDKLSALWAIVVQKDKELKLSEASRHRRRQHDAFKKAQNNFDKLLKQEKNIFKKNQELDLENAVGSNPRDFWAKMSKLGPRREDNQLMEVNGENGETF